jgi:glycopeptide antibiotics resistance protein
MSPDQLDVPALPILLPLGLVLMAAWWFVLRRCHRLTVWRLEAGWVAGWYAVAVIGATLLPLHLAWGPGAGTPESYRIILLPLVAMRVDDFLLNIVMTLPLAAVLHVLAGIRDKRRVVLIGFMLTATIETIQAILVITAHGNRWADVNDLIANTLGALLGYLAFRRFLRFEQFRRVVEKSSFAGERRPRRALRSDSRGGSA